MKKIILSGIAALACASCLYASGYRIPEQGVAGTAKSAANVAFNNGADSAYYNPANMVFLEDKSYSELALAYINLPSIKYVDNQNPKLLNSNSTVEHSVAPTLHYVSPFLAKDVRFGVSFGVPGGLSKRWTDMYAKATAEEFSMKILELNPSVAYKISDVFSVGVGVRMTYADGIVKSNLVKPDANNTMIFSRDLDGDSIDFGYNVALTYKPINELTISSTYRSKIDLSIEGTATLKGGPIKKPFTYDGGAGITIPLPAVFDLAVGYDFGDTTVEFVYERTFWSSYKELDFFYDTDLTKHQVLAPFDEVKPRNWEDVNAYRIGIAHKFTDKFTAMAGFAYDEAPTTDDEFVGFELPDSNAKLYSVGALYNINKDMSIGLAYLYDKKDKREINERSKTKPAEINGKFSDAAAHLVSASFSYRF